MKASPAAVRVIWPESKLFAHDASSLETLGQKLGSVYDLEAPRIVRAYLRGKLQPSPMLDTEGREHLVVLVGGAIVTWTDLLKELGLGD